MIENGEGERPKEDLRLRCEDGRHRGSGGKRAPFLILGAAIFASSLLVCPASGQDLGLNPTRPTIANGAGIQNKGVAQLEVGYDGYPQRMPGNQQTLATSFFYAPLERLRLDFEWSPVTHQESDGERATGVGTIQAGGKAVLWKEDYHRAAPGVALRYEAEFPTASAAALQNRGQQIIVLANHHYGKSGIVDVIVNGSLVQSDCQTDTRCSYGGQQSLAFSFHLHENTRLYGELFGQNNSASNTPPGTYVFGGFYHKLSDAFGVDGGLRFGVSKRSARVGFTLGLVTGKRLQHEAIKIKRIHS